MWIKFRNDHLLDSSLFKLGYATILVPNLTLKDRSIKKKRSTKCKTIGFPFIEFAEFLKV